jgi:hypothetical protein
MEMNFPRARIGKQQCSTIRLGIFCEFSNSLVIKALLTL